MSGSIKPRLAKGTRDFSPEDMSLRNHIFDVIRMQYELFGFEQIETPAVENLETLTGKYGDEGDKLIFKILNSGDYLSKADESLLKEKDSEKLLPQISEKALRYDLTVPFARYVVQHRNDISFPFRRYQIQPVWRADRPQKGRYREFFQCDADVIGSDSLLNEAEFVSLMDKVFDQLDINVVIKLNNRKVLYGFCEHNGIVDKFQEFTVILDKLDKKPWEDLTQDFLNAGFSENVVNNAKSLVSKSGSSFSKESINSVSELVGSSDTGLKGIEELNEIADYIQGIGLKRAKVELDLSLARGLNYYTGAIIEVKAMDHQIGSICGGGRYDDLTGIFGMPDVSGIGISFGIDRIFDIMKNQGWTERAKAKGILIMNFGPEVLKFNLEMLEELRENNISAVLYPDNDKLKKQFKYADQKQFELVLMAGDEEMKRNVFSIKNLSTGDQKEVQREDVVSELKNK